VAAYLRQTALANPHARIHYRNPKGERFEYPRVVAELPVEPKEIKRHPHGVELGTLIELMQDAKKQSVSSFLQSEFSRVPSQAAQEICAAADVSPTAQAGKLHRDSAEKLYKAIQQAKLMSPAHQLPLAHRRGGHRQGPVLALRRGAEGRHRRRRGPGRAHGQGRRRQERQGRQGRAGRPLQRPRRRARRGGRRPPREGHPEDEAGVAKGVQQVKLDEEGAFASEQEGYFVTAVTRPPAVYRGNPFQVEAGIFYGKGLPSDELARVYRFANRVPLQYQAAACAMFKSVVSSPWRNYEVQQSKGALPTGPIVIMVHIASAWVPYTSESKEAIAHYQEILKELRLAIMECGRRLQRFLRKKRREHDEAKKLSYITKYLDPIGEALQQLLSLTDEERDLTLDDLKVILERSRDTKPTAANRRAKTVG
jgi:DNA topoisomerase VI subunit B